MVRTTNEIINKTLEKHIKLLKYDEHKEAFFYSVECACCGTGFYISHDYTAPYQRYKEFNCDTCDYYLGQFLESNFRCCKAHDYVGEVLSRS